MNKFLISDESLNTYGFKVLTSGIDLSQFKKNPVMYYNHEREKGVIGKWVNIQKESKELFAEPLFDEKDELGRKIAGKVQDGFISGASIGITNVIIEEINGESIATSCTLIECSVCDIPSNSNALRVYVDDKQLNEKELLELVMPKSTTKEDDLSQVKAVLGISPQSSLEKVLETLKTLKNKDSNTLSLDEAIKNKYIEPYEKDNLIQLAKSNPNEFKAYLSHRITAIQDKRASTSLALINNAVKASKLHCDKEGKVKQFWINAFKLDFEGAKTAIESLPKRVNVSDLITQMNDNENKANWTLTDYRKRAPLELQRDPALFQRLLQEEKENRK